MMSEVIDESKMLKWCHVLSQYVTRWITVSHNVHKFTIDVTYVQKGVQLVTKVCYYLEFSYIYKYLIITKKALCLIAEGCTSGVDIINWLSVTYVVLFSLPIEINKSEIKRQTDSASCCTEWHIRSAAVPIWIHVCFVVVISNFPESLASFYPQWYSCSKAGSTSDISGSYTYTWTGTMHPVLAGKVIHLSVCDMCCYRHH